MRKPSSRCESLSASFALLGLALSPMLLAAEEHAAQPGHEFIVRAARVLDVRRGTYINDAAIRIRGSKFRNNRTRLFCADRITCAPKSATRGA